MAFLQMKDPMGGYTYINLNYIASFRKHKRGCIIVLTNDKEIEVKETFDEVTERISRYFPTY